jgi:hypothetical protein
MSLKLVADNPEPPEGGAGPGPGPVEVIDSPDVGERIREARARCWDALQQPDKAAALREWGA